MMTWGSMNNSMVNRYRDRIPDQQMIDRSLRNIRIRPIRPGDQHRLQLFHRRLSDRTIRLRFHAGKRELSDALAHRYTHLDGHDRAAFVATTGTRGRIIGVARYRRLSPTSAEVAFVVEDAYQHHHIGARLLKRLIEHAQENGITEFVADVLAGNTPALHLLRDAGPTRTHLDTGLYEVHLDLSGLIPKQIEP